MKRNVLLIPMLAGLMLAASCSKDDGTSVVDEVVTPLSDVDQPVAQKTYPLTIQAKKEASVSKIGLGTDGLSQQFENSDKLLLTDETSGTVYAELTLQNGAGTTSATFSKALSEEEKTSMTGKAIRAVIKGTDYADGIQSSTTSLEDAVRKYCYLEANSTFTYAEGAESFSTLTLVDQRAYIAFTVADGQKQVSLKKDGDADYVWKPVSTTEPKVWFAVPEGTYSTRLIKKPLTAQKSNVYNAKCSNVVDLGPEWSILWKTTNETGGTATSYNQSDEETSVYKDEKYYNWSNACRAFGRESDEGYVTGSFRLPTQAEFIALANLANNTQFVTHNGMACKEFTNDYGSVFFPAAGSDGGDGAGFYGVHWSGTEYVDNVYSAWYLGFDSGDADVVWYNVKYECSVRLVRGL